ncbi:MAG: Rne/Rng family ribonuclease [Planctomycetes bacterium]|nr:Rne/Rng family ribonuclease [Planctomycetota bacterium]
MKRYMLMNVVDPEEIRVAITGDEGLEELYLERTGKGFQAGNIYKGKVQNIEPRLQAAFIDIGGEKNAFLAASDVIPPDGGYKGILKKRRGRRLDGEGHPPIEKMLWKGQELLVQITRESIGNKGPSVTTYISLPGRYLVLMPAVAKRGVSKKIHDDKERKELREALEQLDPPSDLGFIIRTAGQGKGGQELKNDLDYLMRLWKAIVRRTKTAKSATLIYEENDLVIRAIRDFMQENVSEILIDREEEFKRARDFLGTVMPNFKKRAKLYDSNDTLFHQFGIDQEIEKAFSRRVNLKSGGTLIIEPTEAMVTIDVNSGRFNKGDKLQEMILQINCEAAKMIARQLRLRDLGGLIMLDFIDMERTSDRRKVEKVFQDALAPDRARMTVLPISPLGVMEMTRQRVRQNLRAAVLSPCPSCGGTGMTKSFESLGLDFIRTLRQKFTERQGVLEVTMHPKAASYIQNIRRIDIAELEKEYASQVRIKTEMAVPFDTISFNWLENDKNGAEARNPIANVRP